MIQINDNFRIVRIDKYNIELQELKAVTNKATEEISYEWRGVGYYSNLRSALRGLLKEYSCCIVDEKIYEIKEVIARIDKLESDIMALDIKG